MTERPWEVGDIDQRWNGYLDLDHFDPVADGYVLRNKLGAETMHELRVAEDPMVEARALTLPGFGIPSTYDLDGLQQIHHHLFQDVYEWAGDLRTVDIAKETSFVAYGDIETVIDAVARQIEAADCFRGVPEQHIPDALAMTYYGINVAHPFREGNGRTQRVFLNALAAESGHQIEWQAQPRTTNDRVSIEAAQKNSIEPIADMLRKITTRIPEEPAPERPRWMEAAEAYRDARTPDEPARVADHDERGRYRSR